VTLNDRAPVGREPDRFGFGDQIADGEREAVFADHHTVAEAFGAENGRSERVLRDLRAQFHHRVEHGGQIKAQFSRVRLQLGGEGPAFGFGHGDAILLDPGIRRGEVLRNVGCCQNSGWV